MKFQQTRFSCGPASLINGFRALGLLVPKEPTIIRLCATTKKNGTTELDLAAGVVLLGYDVGGTESRNDVDYYLAQGRPVMLVAYNDTHWVTVVGQLGRDRWVVVDPDPDPWNTRENGCYVVHPDKLETKYVGIAILGKHSRQPKPKSRKRSRK